MILARSSMALNWLCFRCSNPQGVPSQRKTCAVRLPAALRAALSALPGNRSSGGAQARYNQKPQSGARDNPIRTGVLLKSAALTFANKLRFELIAP